MSFDYMGEAPAEPCEQSTIEIHNPYMEEVMKCPYLNRWMVATCKIGERIYVPSVFQLEEYCRTRGHRKCPFFMTNVRTKKGTMEQVSLPGPA